jgi:hypothetical protein
MSAVWFHPREEQTMRATLRGLALFGAVLVAVAAPVPAAVADSGGSSGWEPSSTPPFHLAAGESCAFELQADVLYNHELTRVVERYPDGSTRVVDTQGSLGFRFTNLDTGESIRRDTSGTLRATIHEDGSIEFAFGGNGLAVIRSTNTIYQPGVYVVSGNADYIRHADGQREFIEVDGTLEDVCQTLG